MPIVTNIIFNLFLLIICIVAIRFLWRKVFPMPTNPDFRWQAETDYDVTTTKTTEHKGGLDTHIITKDPQKQAKYFAPKAKK